MKLNDVVFYGFTREELEDIHRETGLIGEEEFFLGFEKKVSSVVGIGVITIIFSDGQIAMIKGGE